MGTRKMKMSMEMSTVMIMVRRQKRHLRQKLRNKQS